MSETIDSTPSSTSRDAPVAEEAELRLSRSDFMMLTKARLSALVVVTTFAGYWLGSDELQGWRLAHAIFGTLLCAFGAAVFNQLMEIEPDARMKRTAHRPLPGRRIPPAAAFALGMLFCGWGIIHLDGMANIEAAGLAAATILIYLFVYTPLKQRSSLNTLVGAVSGALPPLIGWVAATGGPSGNGFRWQLLMTPEAVFLFTLLFLWQMPHFLAINWMYRGEYIRAGFVMWSNDDESGAKTGSLSLFFAALLIPLMLVPAWTGFANAWFSWAAMLAAVALFWLAFEFFRKRSRSAARKLFFATLLFLPVVLLLLLLAAHPRSPVQ